MATILSTRAIGNGEYRFTCLTKDKCVKNEKNEKGFKFNFTIYPESCCPPFFAGYAGLHLDASKDTWDKIPNLKELVKEIIDENVLKWMNSMRYNPHDDDKSREKYKIISSFFNVAQPDSYDFRNAMITEKKHKKNYKILTSKKNFNMSKLDLTDFKVFEIKK